MECILNGQSLDFVWVHHASVNVLEGTSILISHAASFECLVRGNIYTCAIISGHYFTDDHVALQSNEILNVFQDDFDMLGDKNEAAASEQNLAAFKE